MKYLTTALLLCCFSYAFSQSNKHGFEFWGAYISSVQLSEKYSLWNDFHLVTNSFFISRHGLTRHFGKALSLSGGYAWLRTSTSFSDHLIRQEHRPWLQLEWVTKLSPKNNYRIQLTRRQSEIIFWGTTVVMPSIVLCFGLMVWATRRAS